MHHSRRAFLQSALFLPSALAASANVAQDSPAVPFADFENGWGDWTFAGDAFGSAPATDALFPGKVRGFGGRAYASTFHLGRGVKATGRAVSREFTIAKPVITFKIGGGDFPGAACLNLVVDGRVVRTATGDGTAKLSARSWDVTEFAGKKARLEIVDSTASEKRGYILVDDVYFAAFPSDTSLAANGGGLTSEAFTPDEYGDEYFISSSAERRMVRSYTAISLTSNGEVPGNPVKTGSSRLRQIQTRIGTRMIQPDFDHIPGTSIVALASKIKKAVLPILAEERIDPASIVGQRLMARGVCDWVRIHVLYNEALTPVRYTSQYSYPNSVLERFWTPKLLLKEPKLLAVCAGIARLTLELSQEVGLHCDLVSGFTRDYNNTTPPRKNHAWDVFTFSDANGKKEICPADNTQALVHLSRARELAQVPPNPFSLPDNDSALGLFLWKLQASEADRGGPLKEELGLSRLSIAEWKKVPRDQVMERVMYKVRTELKSATVTISPL